MIILNTDESCPHPRMLSDFQLLCKVLQTHNKAPSPNHPPPACPLLCSGGEATTQPKVGSPQEEDNPK